MVVLKYRLAKPYLSASDFEAVTDVLRSGWLAEGKVTAEFEEQLAKVVGVKYAVAVSNCTTAITLALKAHEIHGEVIIPDFTHPATALAVLNAECKPVLVDVDLKTYNMNWRTLYSCDSFVPVSWGGNPIHPEYGLIVEDAACSLGTLENPRHTCCLSFHPRKIVTTGEGGAVLTNDQQIADRVRSLKNFGQGGSNYKLNDMASALGLSQLRRLDDIVFRRRQMAHLYTDLLSNNPSVSCPYQNGGTYQTYAVLLHKGNRDRIIKQLTIKGIEVQRGAFALHLLPQFMYLHPENDLPNSEILDRNLLALPMSYDITDEGQQFIVDELCHCLNA